MVRGVGIDIVHMADMRNQLELPGFKLRTFTAEEVRYAEKAASTIETFAGTFAAKEAVFKSLAPMCGRTLDWRGIEVLRRSDGSPYVELKGELGDVATTLKVQSVVISITNEDDLAAAIAISQSDEACCLAEEKHDFCVGRSPHCP